eukprot:gb/GECG01016560.1/.p1 GENE.gb/GECG01016560.1/~~gb/GECG01016560.1/.p1  ORF type:complete len:295 (+),score=27.72 gb/GECG01016560.1/:1-885(+)
MLSCTWTDPRTRKPYSVDLTNGIDISTSIRPYEAEEEQANAFGLPAAKAQPVQLGNFVGSIEAGASVNCPVIQICAHGNGTHTECVGHVVRKRITLADTQITVGKDFIPCIVLDVIPKKFREATEDDTTSYPAASAEDLVIDRGCLREAMRSLAGSPESDETWKSFAKAIVIRALVNGTDKRKRHWGGTGAPYFTKSSMDFLVSLQCENIIVDLPSMDKEDDQGYLIAHKTFWQVEGSEDTLPARSYTTSITELAYIPESVSTGRYMLQLQVSPLEGDAAPSRPVLFPLSEQLV